MEHNIKPLETHHALTDLLDQQEKLDAKIIKVKAIVTHREQTMARCAATCASLEQLPFDHAAVRRADEQYLHAEEAWKDALRSLADLQDEQLFNSDVQAGLVCRCILEMSDALTDLEKRLSHHGI